MNVSREYFLSGGAMGLATDDFSLSDESHFRDIAVIRTCNLFSNSFDDWQPMMQSGQLLACPLTPAAVPAHPYDRISVDHTPIIINGSRSPPG